MTNSAGSLWRKSSWSDNQGGCVTVANLGSHCAVKDSKDLDGEGFVVSKEAWRAFVAAVKRGEFESSAGRAAHCRHVPPLLHRSALDGVQERRPGIRREG
ncbi:DUF397 domain-containing protein [Nonomuraea terrae]|uniref:DUF397 domain-containing protein n=1 Tax=Nonomuraea terrae TaxID=2530383 RepID=UPI00378E00C9